MKKLFIAIAAVALVFSASCTKVNPDEKKSEKISFSVASYVPATKAGEVSFLNEFTDKTKAQFYCKAFMFGEGVYEGETETLKEQLFFGEKETIKPDNTTSPTKWAPSHDYYWPKSSKSYINFFSWYDSSTTDGPTVTNGTMKWENRVIGTGDNIMYADPAWHFQQNNNPATYGIDDVDEGVPTLFHHALAQVEFRAYATKLSNTNPAVTWTIKLTGIEIGKIVNKGTLSLSATEPAATVLNSKGEWTGTGTDGAPAWAASTAEADKGSLKPADYTLTTNAAAFLANQSVMPQDLTGVNLTFKLDITTTYGSGASAISNQEIISTTIPLTSFVSSAEGNPAITAWALNTKYIYTIKVVPGENIVLFDPAVEKAWETVTATEKTL